jgi:hypothetical protein
MTDKILVSRELLERILTKMNIVWQQTDEMVALRAALSAPVQQQEPVAWRKCRVISYSPGIGEVTFHVDDYVPAFMDVGETIYVSNAHPAPADALVDLLDQLANGSHLDKVPNHDDDSLRELARMHGDKRLMRHAERIEAALAAARDSGHANKR